MTAERQAQKESDRIIASIFVCGELGDHLRKAFTKHPEKVSPFERLAAITEELGEAAQAILDNQTDKAIDELWDLAAVVIRGIKELEQKETKP